jgi:membrane protein required for colicin V production
MNWLDILLLLILIGSILASYRKGFSREVIGLVTVVLALVAGAWFYGMAGAFLIPYVSSRSVANLIGFFLVFIGVMLLGGILSYIVGKFLRVTGISIVDHALGAGFGLLRGVLIGVALILGIMAFAPNERPPAAIIGSRTAPYFVDAARVVAAVTPYELKEGFRKSYAEAKDAWARAWEKGLRNVPGTHKGQHEREI